MRTPSVVATIMWVLPLCGLLSACGGGGGGDTPTAAVLQVDAGAARTLALPDNLALSPTVTLDGLPAGDRAAYQWRQLDGPGSVNFSDAAIATPLATFPLNGSYRLALDASFETQTVSDVLEVTVNTRAGGASGLATLPDNTVQCVAPADAGIPDAIRLATPYPGLPALNLLVALIQAPGDDSVWYAVEQSGSVVRFDNDPAVTAASSFIDISDRVDSGGEKGLLGMAFHPDYANNGYVYLSYTAAPASGLESRISRFTLDTASGTLDPASEQIILRVAQPFSNHNGGGIAFGPDGLLYIGLGDGGSGGDPNGNGQNPATLLGSMLRIDVGNGSSGYTIPPDNPFAAGGGAPEVYAYGLRNPWRWSFDRTSGDLWVGDVGQGAYGGYLVTRMIDSGLNISAFAEDQRGELYVLGLNGSIRKVAADNTGATGSVPATLSGWGCFQSGDVPRFSGSVIPYDVNARLWSDFADKERFMAIPAGSAITIDSEGRFVFPPGSVLGKHFRVDGQLVETRLFMRHANSGWRGYSYEWNAARSDADLLTAAKDKTVGGRNWHFPSPTQCLVCHTAVAGFSLGPEVGQLNRDFAYPNGSANQLITLEAVGALGDPLTEPQKSTAFYAIDDTAYSAERRARSYLHANCANCHQPGGPGGGNLDLRMGVGLADTGVCNLAPQVGDLGLSNPVLLKPGDPDNSILLLRMASLGDVRMPPLDSSEIDNAALAVVRAWISGLAGCD
ncbi:MAG: PQQ-dependent sugar dehydrogenase [Candidatus Thiodiazotropha sp.]